MVNGYMDWTGRRRVNEVEEDMAAFGYRRISKDVVEIFVEEGRTMNVNRKVCLNALLNAEENPEYFKDKQTFEDYKAMYEGALAELKKPLKVPA